MKKFGILPILFALSGRLFGGTHTFVRSDVYGQYIVFIHQFLNSLFAQTVKTSLRNFTPQLLNSTA